MPYFSIVIPTFNSGATLHKCISSILAQTFFNYEILIMDGVSMDNTLAILSSFHDSRIKVFSEPDDGIYDAMNKGIKIAKGEWLYFLGSDDTLFDKDILKKIYDKSRENYYDVIYGNVLSKKHGGIYNGEWSVEKIGYNICHQAIFYRNQLLIKLHKFNTTYRVSADHDLNIKWFFDKKIKHCYVNEIIANFSDGGFSSLQSDIAFDKNMNYIIFKRGFNGIEKRILKEYANRSFSDKMKEKKYILSFCLKIVYYYLRFILYIKK